MAPRLIRRLAVVGAGLAVAGSWNGAWFPPAEYEGGQDLFVVVKG